MLLPSEFPDQAGLAADALPDTRGTFEPQVHMEGAVSGIPLQACHEDGAVAAHGDRGRIHAVIAQFRAGRAVELMFPGHARVGTEALENLIAQAGAHAEQAGIHGIEAEVLAHDADVLSVLMVPEKAGPAVQAHAFRGLPLVAEAGEQAVVGRGRIEVGRLLERAGDVLALPVAVDLSQPQTGLRVQADAYYNTVRDKVVAYPKGQQFRWTMLNLGRVHIAGTDVGVAVTLSPAPELSVTGRIQYTYQQARDVTDPATSYYNDQIPYIPQHSGSAVLGLSYRTFDFNYSFIYAGERYSQQENIPANHVQPWYTSDLSLAYRLAIRKARLRFALEVNNVFSQDYDVILNYPMPKRNYAVSIDVEI